MWIGSRKWSADCFNIIVKLLLIAFDYMTAMGFTGRKQASKKRNKSGRSDSNGKKKRNHIKMANATKLKHLNLLLRFGAVTKFRNRLHCVDIHYYMVHSLYNFWRIWWHFDKDLMHVHCSFFKVCVCISIANIEQRHTLTFLIE